MRQAAFITIFVGIETPETEALKGIVKEQNAAVPMLEGIRTINSYGLEVTSGIIFGLDTETAESERRLIEFVEASQVPILTMNLLQALPKTPLWDRLAKAGRLIDDPNLESNVRFLRPHDEVLASWRRTIAYCYAPERVFGRYRHQIEATYANRIKTPARAKLTWRNIRRGLELRPARLDAGENTAFFEPRARCRRTPERLALRIAQVPLDRLKIGIDRHIVRAIDLDSVTIGIANIKKERVGNAVPPRPA